MRMLLDKISLNSNSTQITEVGWARLGLVYRDWAAATWVDNVNTGKGVAVPTRAVVEKMDTGTLASAEDRWACRRGLQRLSQGERAWACRWRRRVGAYAVSYTHLRAHET